MRIELGINWQEGILISIGIVKSYSTQATLISTGIQNNEMQSVFKKRPKAKAPIVTPPWAP